MIIFWLVLDQRKRKLESLEKEDDPETIIMRLSDKAAQFHVQRFKCALKSKVKKSPFFPARNSALVIHLWICDVLAEIALRCCCFKKKLCWKIHGFNWIWWEGTFSLIAYYLDRVLPHSNHISLLLRFLLLTEFLGFPEPINPLHESNFCNHFPLKKVLEKECCFRKSRKLISLPNIYSTVPDWCSLSHSFVYPTCLWLYI